MSLDTLKPEQNQPDDTSRHYPCITMAHRRDSLPVQLALSPKSLPRFGSIPCHDIANTSVRFHGIESVENHCQFRLLVDTGKVQFILQKRYSDFRALRQQLLSSCDENQHDRKCQNGACRQLVLELNNMKFPRRKLRFKNRLRTAMERLGQLQHFVDTVLTVYRTASKRQVRCCVNAQCVVLKAIQDFLKLRGKTPNHDSNKSLHPVSPGPRLRQK